ncbi:hypothetical protein J2D73_08800 [Acetobacter sacchari]|uniref:Band 7 domain-containing protein n=1 Tax=Acetobacter sacchari TaxID=2661687 RepID=A0ABS3LVE5_9PROT|nr:SPFH domain-containing protein [Acetobacter sacchari]MBO1359892.1 hypothetical protein [Acetobacter sacchari]
MSASARPLPVDQAHGDTSIAPVLISGPLEQTVRFTFLLLAAVTALLGLFWLTGNVRSVPTDSTAVVILYGKVVDVRRSGLVVALPRPFEEVTLLPSSDHQISLRVTRDNTAYASDETDLELQESDDWLHMEKNRDAANSSYLLTGDGNIVRLDATLFYKVVRPVAYMQAQRHAPPALRRTFYAAATHIAASHPIGDFLVMRSGGGETGADEATTRRRTALRQALMDEVNARLRALTGPNADLGIEVTRIDLVPILPPRAKEAFDQVLTAEQVSAQGVAAARTDAERVIQNANRERDRLQTDASAAAEEMVRQASASTATISADETAAADALQPVRDAAALKAWRDRVAVFMSRVGEITSVAPGTGQTILSISPTAPQAQGNAQ